MTQLEYARQGTITALMEEAALAEGVSPEFIRDGVAAGNIVICHNRTRGGGRPLAVGKGLRTKVNANIGTSADDLDIAKELEKARVAVASGADAIMDLSTGGPVDAIRRAIIAETAACIGSVPLYQAALDAVRTKQKAIVDMTVADIFDGIAKHVEDGRTVSEIAPLNAADRVREIARMLGGQSDAARKHAEAMLRQIHPSA